jgi:hypothetical protein
MAPAALSIQRGAAITTRVALRAMPQIGGSVMVSFLGSRVRGTVDSIDADGRRLRVTTEQGEALTFALNGATATFTAEGDQTGARLAFEHDPHS